LFRFVSKDTISFYPPLINTTSNVFPNNARLHVITHLAAVLFILFIIKPFPINARLHVITHLAAVLFILFIIKQLYGPLYKPFAFTPGGIKFQTLLLNAFII
jgi:hypothetical protein